jgi:hypothetical protein
VLQRFNNGMALEVSDQMPAMEYVHQVSEIKGLKAGVAKLNVQGSPAAIASAVEFILEGLHLNRRLNKDRAAFRQAMVENLPRMARLSHRAVISAKDSKGKTID